jgi:hypothetical protein
MDLLEVSSTAASIFPQRLRDPSHDRRDRQIALERIRHDRRDTFAISRFVSRAELQRHLTVW